MEHPKVAFHPQTIRTLALDRPSTHAMIQFAQLAPEAPLTRGDLSPLLDRVVFMDRDFASSSNGSMDRAH